MIAVKLILLLLFQSNEYLIINNVTETKNYIIIEYRIYASNVFHKNHKNEKMFTQIKNGIDTILNYKKDEIYEINTTFNTFPSELKNLNYYEKKYVRKIKKKRILIKSIKIGFSYFKLDNDFCGVSYLFSDFYELPTPQGK